MGLGFVAGPAYWIGNQVIVQRTLGARSVGHARGGVFFGALITNYLLFNGREITPGAPIPFETYDIPFTSISSFILLMSSLTMVLAHHSATRGDWRQMRVWLFATAFLGLTFLAGQVFEFTVFVEEWVGIGAGEGPLDRTPRDVEGVDREVVMMDQLVVPGRAGAVEDYGEIGGRTRSAGTIPSGPAAEGARSRRVRGSVARTLRGGCLVGTDTIGRGRRSGAARRQAPALY